MGNDTAAGVVGIEILDVVGNFETEIFLGKREVRRIDKSCVNCAFLYRLDNSRYCPELYELHVFFVVDSGLLQGSLEDYVTCGKLNQPNFFPLIGFQIFSRELRQPLGAGDYGLTADHHAPDEGELASLGNEQQRRGGAKGSHVQLFSLQGCQSFSGAAELIQLHVDPFFFEIPFFFCHEIETVGRFRDIADPQFGQVGCSGCRSHRYEQQYQSDQSFH